MTIETELVNNKIPEISDEKLKDLMGKIRPLGRFSRKLSSKVDELFRDSDGDLYFLQDGNPRQNGFIYLEPLELAESINQTPYDSIRTFHTAGAMSFIPTVAEVLAQIPEKDIERCVAFEIGYKGTTGGGSYDIGETSLYELR